MSGVRLNNLGIQELRDLGIQKLENQGLRTWHLLLIPKSAIPESLKS